MKSNCYDLVKIVHPIHHIFATIVNDFNNFISHKNNQKNQIDVIMNDNLNRIMETVDQWDTQLNVDLAKLYFILQWVYIATSNYCHQMIKMFYFQLFWQIKGLIVL